MSALDTSLQPRFEPYLTVWVDAVLVIHRFPDTPAGLEQAKKCLIEEWNNVRVPLSTPVSAIQWLETQFYVRRIVDGKPDECVCTFAEAIQSQQ